MTFGCMKFEPFIMILTRKDTLQYEKCLLFHLRIPFEDNELNKTLCCRMFLFFLTVTFPRFMFVLMLCIPVNNLSVMLS